MVSKSPLPAPPPQSDPFRKPTPEEELIAQSELSLFSKRRIAHNPSISLTSFQKASVYDLHLPPQYEHNSAKSSDRPVDISGMQTKGIYGKQPPCISAFF
jgi:hypothetical protein